MQNSERCRVLRRSIRQGETAGDRRQSPSTRGYRREYASTDDVGMEIDAHPGCPLREMADGLDVTMPTASVGGRRLEESGLIERSSDPDDRRVVRLQLTTAGRTLVQSARRFRMNKMQLLVNELSRDEQDMLRDLLDKALSSAEECNRNAKTKRSRLEGTPMRIVDAMTAAQTANPHQVDVRGLHENDHVQVVMVTLQPGEALKRHITPVDVCFYVLDGEGIIEIGDEQAHVSKDMLIDSPARVPHRLSNPSNSKFRFLVIKTPRPTARTQIL